jgi:hypothetical protein
VFLAIYVRGSIHLVSGKNYARSFTKYVQNTSINLGEKTTNRGKEKNGEEGKTKRMYNKIYDRKRL